MFRQVGTVVQYRNGYVKVKIEDDEGKPTWQARSRRNWELKHGTLEEGDRVFHIDGNRENDDPRNLAKVHFNAVKFVVLNKARVLYDPAVQNRRKLHVA